MDEKRFKINEYAIYASFITHINTSDDDDTDGNNFNVVEDDSGAHFNFSLWHRKQGSDKKKDRMNACWNSNENKLSNIALYFSGCILSHIRGICAFVCPSVICYETRFNSPWVSSYGNWGKYNRTALIRVKSNKNG